MKLKRLFVLFLLFALCTMHAYAAEPGEGVSTADPDVSISAAKPTYTGSGVAVSVETVFHDFSLYHEQVFLSYHVFDMDENLILFENQRLPLAPDETGTAINELLIDFTNVPELANIQQAQIQFDLVDEKNAFWFADNTTIELQIASVLFDRANVVEDELRPRDVYLPQVLSVALCILGWGALVFGIWRIKRKPKRIE